MEAAIGLIEQAKVASGEQRDALLERLLTLIRGVIEAPEMLEELLPIVLELQEDECWRSFIASFIEGCCLRRPSLILNAIETLRSLARDTDVAVLKALIQCASSLYRTVLALACSDDGQVAEAEMSDLWKEWQALCTAIQAMVSHSECVVRNCAIKFVEAAALLLTASDDPDSQDLDPSGAASNEWTIHNIPAVHSVLDVSDLRQQGEACVSLLARVAKGEGQAGVQTMLVALNSLGRVSRKRTHLLSQIEPHLGEALTMARPDTPNHHVQHLHMTIKSILLGLLKLPSCSAYAAVLGEHLHSLGADVLAEAARRQMEKTRAMASRSRASKRSGHPGVLEGEREGGKRQRGAQQSALSSMQASLPLSLPLEEWQPALLAELIVTAMANYPPALPPHLIDVADTPLHMWPPRLAFPSLNKDARAQESRDEGEGAEAGDKGGAASASADKMRSKALLQAKGLKRDTAARFAGEAMTRVMHGEEGTWVHRSAVVARLFAAEGLEGGDLRAGLIGHILESYGERHVLAIQWLHELFITDLKGGGGDGKKGGGGCQWALLKLFDGLVEKGGLGGAGSGRKESEAVAETRLVTRLLAEAPFVGDACVERVRSLCEQGDQRLKQVGLACLRTLILHHDCWKGVCLERLLGYAVAEDEAIRGPAIRLVCGKLLETGTLSEEIERQAVANLRLACRLEGAAAEGRMEVDEEGEHQKLGVDKPRMHLFLSLCAQRHALLSHLLQAYLDASPAVRTGVHNAVSDMVRAIGPDSPQLIDLIRSCPGGAEVLVLAFVSTLTEGGAAHPTVVATIKELYARGGDARFMIYIVAGLPREEVLEVLPSIVALPPVGVKAALKRIIFAHPAPLTPEKLIVALHKLSPTKALPVRKIAEAIEAAFQEKEVFTTQVKAVVLQQLLDQSPVPMLYMRTVMLCLKISPSLTNFVMGILHRLVSKQVWEMPTLWEGFVKCCRQTQPRSLEVLLQLPPARLQDALSHCRDLAEPLLKYMQQQQQQQQHGAQVPQRLFQVVEASLKGNAGGADGGVQQ